MNKSKITIAFIFLIFMAIGLSSCAVRLTETHRNHGEHRGWFKQKSHHPHQTWVIRKSTHKQPKATRTVKVEVKNKKKNRWDAQK